VPVDRELERYAARAQATRFASESIKQIWAQREYVTWVCTECGTGFQSRHAQPVRFCGGTCAPRGAAAKRRRVGRPEATSDYPAAAIRTEMSTGDGSCGMATS
jgi:hypothetical protein